MSNTSLYNYIGSILWVFFVDVHRDDFSSYDTGLTLILLLCCTTPLLVTRHDFLLPFFDGVKS